MDVLEQLRGLDAYRYIGASVSISLVSGEEIRGELYCVDLQRNQTMIIRARHEQGDDSLYVVRAAAVTRFEALGPLNDSFDELPRVQPEDLIQCKAMLLRQADDGGHRRTQHDAQNRVHHHKQ